MDSQVVPVNPPAKTPVVRGARACTVCRQAKMKCVGAEDGSKCQRCLRSGAECIFEKHRRGRKPGSKLSEASKMLRRLEKGLNNAKAKQPSNPAVPHASSSSAFDDPSSASYAGPSNGGHSGHQSDDDMEEDEDDRPVIPAQAIRAAARSSFMDVVMNPSPENPVASSSPTERLSPLASKAASQSPPRSHGSPQLKPSSDLFPMPRDPVESGDISENDVGTFFDLFFLRLNPFINLFDPALHSHEYVRSHSPFLFTAMLMACCKFFRPEKYQDVRRLAQQWCLYAFAEGIESVETVQALACMTYWKEPKDQRTWQYIGMACRMAVNLKLNRYAPQANESDLQFFERRNRERTFLVLFVHDRSLSMQTGKQWMLTDQDELVRRYRTWHEEGLGGHRRDVRPEDIILAAFVNLRLIGSEATNTLYTSRDVFDMELHRYNDELKQWLEFWTAQMNKSPLADPFHSAFLKFFRSHVVLFLNSFGLNLSNVEKSRAMPNKEAVDQCELSACTNLQIVSKDFAATNVLRYGQESTTAMSAYAAIVLLKLLRNPATCSLLTIDAQGIHHIINDAARAYESAGHLTGSEMNSAAYHARFLRNLLALDAQQQHTEPKSHRAEAGPSSFSQGLPPIRTSQLSMSAGLSLDAYSSQRAHHMSPHHLAPLSIPASTQGAFSNGHHTEYGSMESAMRAGMSPAPHRAPSYPTMPLWSESDQHYFQDMIHEVGEVGENFLGNPNTFPQPTPSYMGEGGAGGAMQRYGFSSHCREPSQMSYGVHGHSRSASYQQHPPAVYGNYPGPR